MQHMYEFSIAIVNLFEDIKMHLIQQRAILENKNVIRVSMQSSCKL